MEPGPGVDVPAAFNAFAQLVLAPAGIVVEPLSEMPTDREWSGLMDEHGLRDQWTAYVVALLQAQALACAPTAERRARLRREFEWYGSAQLRRLSFVVDLKRVLTGDFDGSDFCSMYGLPQDVVRAIIEGASKTAGPVGIAAKLSVEIGLFGDGRENHFKRNDTPEGRLERARNAFNQAIKAARSIE